MTNPGKKWTVDELTLVTEEYARMMEATRNGSAYEKKSRAIACAETIGRTRPAVEFVWCNVSAILAQHGYEWSEGHPPLGHYSPLLPDVVRRVFGIE